MSVLHDTWRQLVRRKLWPVALLLLLALVAVPVLLAKEPEVAAPPATPPPSEASLAAGPGDPIVALAGVEDRAKRRRVLGSRKDPFALSPAAARAAADAAEDSTVADNSSGSTDAGGSSDTSSGSGSAGSGSAGTGSGSAGSGTGGSGSAPTFPSTGSDRATPGTGTEDGSSEEDKPTYELYELSVRVGLVESEELEDQTLKRLEPLPSVEAPALVYLGVLEDKKTAVFLLDANVTPDGDGDCKPSTASCETLQLREGETAFLDVEDETGMVVAQYQLDVVKIHRTKTASAAKAKRAYAREAKAGRRALQARIAADGPLRVSYDRDRGVVQRLSRTAYAAVAARAEVLEARLK